VTPFARRVADLQPTDAAGSMRMDGYGSISLTIPPERVAEIVYADPANPANDRTSLIVAWRGLSLIGEWVIDSAPDETRTDGPVQITGPSLEAWALGGEVVEAWDWDGTPIFQSTSPDWQYGDPQPAGSFSNGGLEDATDGFAGNGGAEQGAAYPWTANTDDGYLKPPKGGPDVTTAAPVLSGTYAVIFSATGALSGIQANVDVTPGGNYVVTVNLNDPAVSGERYRLGVRAEEGAVNNSANGESAENDYFWVELDNVVGPGATDGTWQTFVLDFDAGTEQTTARIVLIYDDAGTPTFGNIHVDDVTVAGPLVGVKPWEPVPHPDITTPVFRLETTVVRTGLASLAVQVADSGTANGGARQKVTRLIPGATYTFEAWVRQNSGVAHDFRAVLKRPAGVQVDGSATSVPSGVWTKVAVTGAVDTSEVWVDLRWVDTGTSPLFYIDDAAYYRGLASTTTGDIWSQLIADLQAAGALGWLNETYSATVDSDGNAWAQVEALTVKMGQTLAQVRRQFEDRGYEFSLTPTVGTPGEWDLNIYNPLGRGTDQTGADSPSLVIGQGWVSGPITAAPPLANRILVQGADGWTARVEDAPSISSDVGRRVRYVGDLRIPDGNSAADYANQQLDSELASTLEVAVTVAEPTGTEWPRPGTDYVLGDTINVSTTGRPKVARRVRQLDYTDSVTRGTEWIIATSDAFTKYQDRRALPAAAAGANSDAVGILAETVNEILRRFPFLDAPEPFAEAPTFPATGQGGPIEATWFVAGSDQRQALKDVADLILAGADDLTAINTLCNAVSIAGGGRIILGANRIYQSADLSWSIPNNVAVHGMGEEITVIELASGAVDVAVTVSGVLADVGGLTGGL
jgi:hypothetical protein